MRIGIIGTGTMARALGTGWAAAGHHVQVAGRDPARTRDTAAAVGGTAVDLGEVADRADAVLLAVLWTGVAEALSRVGPALDGVPLIDPTNPVAHGRGELLTDRSAAEDIAGWAPGSRVVKAFHLFPAAQWSDPAASAVTVPIVGDHPDALAVVADLVRDVGGRPVVLGGLDRARQLEEAAGFVIGLAFAGADPRSAVPHVPTGG